MKMFDKNGNMALPMTMLICIISFYGSILIISFMGYLCGISTIFDCSKYKVIDTIFPIKPVVCILDKEI